MNLPANTHGALVTSVQRGGPAAQAGLRGGNTNNAISIEGQPTPVGGDIVIAIDGHPITHFEDLTSYLFTKTTVGQTITLTILRAGRQQDIRVTLSARPAASIINR